MTRGRVYALILVGVLFLPSGVGIGVAGESKNGVKRLPDDPVFLQWLDPGDPDDETIREYWERATRGELSPQGMIDLGTMLYFRGYPKDAVRFYRNALDEDKELYEAWYRIGVVEFRDLNYEDARYAYKKCLKILSGHGWCNFYLGLLEEHTGHPSKALDYYKRAYDAAPELADPRVNPDVLYSKLQIGAAMQQQDDQRFVATVPMPFLDPSEVRRVRAQYLPTPTPTPTPYPTVAARGTTRDSSSSTGAAVGGAVGGTAAASGSSTGGGATSPRVRSRPPGTATRPTPGVTEDTPYGVRQPTGSGGSGGGGGVYGSGVQSVSPEATLRPWWTTMPEWILAFV